MQQAHCRVGIGLRNKTIKQKGKKERERDKARNKLLTIENKLMVTSGEMGGGMG